MAKKIPVVASRQGYNLAAGEYDEREKYLNSFEKGRLLGIFKDVKGKKILDVGAGTGRVAAALCAQGAEVVALDVSEEMLAVLKKKNKRVVTVVGDAEALPFPDNEFDYVVAAFLIVHLKDPTRFFDEAFRVLKPGGKLIVSNINQKDPPRIKTTKGEIVITSFYHRPEKIKDILESLSFSIKDEIMVKEGEHWVNQIVVARK